MQDKTIINSLKNVMSDFLNVYKYWIMGSLACAVAIGINGPINALLLSTIINNFVISSKSSMFEYLFWPSFLLLLNFLMHEVSLYLWGFINNKIQPEIKSRVTLFTYKYILQHSPQFYQNNNLNKILQNITLLANSIHNASSRTILHLCSGILTISLALAILYYVNHVIFSIMGCCVIIYSAISYLHYKHIVPLTLEFLGDEKQVAAIISDGIANNIRSNTNNEEVDYLSRKLNEMQKSFRKRSSFIMKNNFMRKLCFIMAIGFVMQVLIHFNALHKLSVGQFVLILSLSVSVGTAFCLLTEHIDDLNNTINEGKICLITLFAPLDSQDKPQATRLIVSAGKIQFNNVNYIGSGLIFKNINMLIKPGQKIGFVGLNSNDKAAFISLLMRSVTVSSGAIKIDNQDISELTQTSINQAIGYISQDAIIFNRTIMENIRYGNKYASEAEVISAAKYALAHQFIENLPFQYNTKVGGNGAKLTPSQRQRIVIARELLKNSPILILDEPIAKEDPLIEQRELEDSIWQFMRNKTALVISNNISTLELLDRVMIFEAGEIFEDRTHERLKISNDLIPNPFFDEQEFQVLAGF